MCTSKRCTYGEQQLSIAKTAAILIMAAILDLRCCEISSTELSTPITLCLDLIIICLGLLEAEIF